MSTRVKLVILLLLVAASGAGAIVNRDDGGGEVPTTPGVRQQSFDLDLAQTWIEPDAPPLVVE